jgi:hypothetical protein
LSSTRRPRSSTRTRSTRIRSPLCNLLVSSVTLQLEQAGGRQLPVRIRQSL